MASYPTSVKNFATRSNGQTIDASHVQDLQDEVSAIETALEGTITHSLNVSGASTLASLQAAASTLASLVVSGGSTLGTVQAGASTVTSLNVSVGSTHAKLEVSGGSTLASLNVTAGSTFATVSVAGGSTFAATMNVVGGSTFAVRPVTPPPDAALVFLAALKDFGSSATSTLSFLSEAFVTNSSIHSTGTNPERLTPQSTGLYQFNAQIAVGVASAGVAIRQPQLVDSSGAVLGNVAHKSTDGIVMQVTGYKRFDALGGYVVFIFGTDGASTHSASSGVGNTWFSMVKL